MVAYHKNIQADLRKLHIIRYPAPELREVCTPISDPADPSVSALVDRMFKLMFEAGGMGLAASQVCVAARLFIASPTFDPTDRRVYINPRIISTSGKVKVKEGCLSVPGISIKIRRAPKAVIEATGLDGERFMEKAEGLLALIFQHEMEHVDGQILVDHMGWFEKLVHHRVLTELRELSGLELSGRSTASG